MGKVEFGKPHGYGELTYAAHDPLGRKSYKGAFAEGLKQWQRLYEVDGWPQL